MTSTVTERNQNRTKQMKASRRHCVIGIWNEKDGEKMLEIEAAKVSHEAMKLKSLTYSMASAMFDGRLLT